MKTFARIEGGVVREIIIRTNAFKIIMAYSSGLISDDLDGTAGAEEGFVLVPDAVTVSEGDLYSGGIFSTPTPPPLPPSDADLADDEAQINLLWRAWVSRQARIEGKTARQIINELRAELP